MEIAAREKKDEGETRTEVASSGKRGGKREKGTERKRKERKE